MRGSKSEKQNGEGTASAAEAAAEGDDLREEIATLRKVNAHLNDEVKAVSAERDTLQREKAALEGMLHSLGCMLREERDRAHTHQAAAGASSSSGAATLPAHEGPEAAAAGSSLASQLYDAAPDAQSVVLSANELAASANWAGLAELRALGTASGWLVEAADLQLGSKFDQGSSGDVYMGRFRGADVVVKVTRIESRKNIVCFLREVRTWAKLRHPHVVPFLGAVITPGPNTCMLISEYMPGGNLKQWLYAAVKPSLAQRLAIAVQVARAMVSLEEMEPTIIHRDLKPSNVLLGAGGEVRLADFSLARSLPPHSAQSPLTGETGTYFYMAPEVIKHQSYTGAADVYSFGVLFNELLAVQIPYTDLYLTPVQVAFGVANDGLRPSVPSDMHPGLTSITDSCWKQNAFKRPTFKEVLTMLEGVVPPILEGLERSRVSSPDSFMWSFFGFSRNGRPGRGCIAPPKVTEPSSPVARNTRIRPNSALP